MSSRACQLCRCKLLSEGQGRSKAHCESHSLQISGMDNRPLSDVPTASSVYSQPSPEMGNTTPTNDHPPRSSSLYPDEVSPPESLHVDDEDKGRGERDSPDVSPISGSSSPSFKHSPASTLGKFNSSLPVPKKTRKFWNRPSLGSPEQGAHLTHWDVYSGEPTTSEKGKPPSTTPSAVKLHADPSPGRLNGYGTSTHISAGNPSPENGIGRKRVASRDLNNAPIIRPEWRGAGGRHKIVNPLLDKPLPPGKNPTFPVGSEKHHQEHRERERIAEEIAREQQEKLKREHMAEERARREQMQKEEARMAEERARVQEKQRQEEKTAEEGAKRHREEERARSKPITKGETWEMKRPSQPSIVLDNTELNRQTALPHQKSLNGSTKQILPVRNSSLTADDTRSPLARNPSNEEMKDRRSQTLPESPHNTAFKERSSPLYNTQKEQLHTASSSVPQDRIDEHDSSHIEGRFRADLQNMRLQDEPPSRFSATTYATTTFDSPPATPELESNSPSTSTTPNSILNRKRPVPPAGIPNSRATARKPAPSEVSVTTQVTPESKRKSLPKSPPEVHAVSRVASLQAKLDNLRRRRGNLQTVIHELTHVVQPSSIAYDMASRQEIKRTVEGLNKELAEVKKDEHETGLKLHRTMKRDDEFAAYEPTSIWVRRVTS